MHRIPRFPMLASLLIGSQLLLWTACSTEAPTETADGDPLATVATGQLRGSRADSGVASFKNIPFAKPPIGELRWREPQPADPWTDVRDATEFGPMCNQNDNQQLPHSEDCLQLNIWTPSWPAAGNLPVMVWVHGGGNTAGSGMEALFNGETLAGEGVVLVNINYRLGVLGFFAHPGLTAESPHHASGNYGLADQVMALEWVRDNIANFGGDPSNVTIFGESAGAIDINALLASPLAEGLFARALTQSGPVGPQASLADSEMAGVAFAVKLGLGEDATIDQLRAVPIETLMENAGRGPGGGGLGINVDGWVIPEPSLKVYAEGRELKVPLMIGNNSQETQGPRGGSADIRELITDRYGPLGHQAMEAYGIAAKGTPEPDPEYGTVMAQWSTDNSFRCGTVEELIWHTKAGNTGYEYQFSRTVHGKEAQGAPHAAEIPFIFGTLPVWQKMRGYDESDHAYAPYLQKYWTNFAKTGDPNGEGLPEWPKFDADQRGYLDFLDDGPVAKDGLRRQVCDVFMENQERMMAQ